MQICDSPTSFCARNAELSPHAAGIFDGRRVQLLQPLAMGCGRLSEMPFEFAHDVRSRTRSTRRGYMSSPGGLTSTSIAGCPSAGRCPPHGRPRRSRRPSGAHRPDAGLRAPSVASRPAVGLSSYHVTVHRCVSLVKGHPVYITSPVAFLLIDTSPFGELWARCLCCTTMLALRHDTRRGVPGYVLAHDVGRAGRMAQRLVSLVGRAVSLHFPYGMAPNPYGALTCTRDTAGSSHGGATQGGTDGADPGAI